MALNCVELSLALPPLPQLPSIFADAGSAGINIQFGTVGTTCCAFTIPGFSPSIPLPMIGPLTAAIQVLNTSLAAAIPILAQIQVPKCSK